MSAWRPDYAICPGETLRDPGSGLSPLLSVAYGLVICCSFGWPYVLVYVLIAGPALGAHQVLSPRKGNGSSAC